MTSTSGEDVKADPVKINELLEVLNAAFKLYIEQHPEMRTIDVFMCAHNFHKDMIATIATQWDKQGIPMNKTIRMADLTFRRAMKELWRK